MTQRQGGLSSWANLLVTTEPVCGTALPFITTQRHFCDLPTGSERQQEDFSKPNNLFPYYNPGANRQCRANRNSQGSDRPLEHFNGGLENKEPQRVPFKTAAILDEDFTNTI